MYHAIMHYYFKPEKFEDAYKKWHAGVANIIGRQKGFIRVQFYSNKSGHAIAIGSWEAKEYADAFMKTGVFLNLLTSFEGMMEKPPQGSPYHLNYFEDKNA